MKEFAKDLIQKENLYLGISNVEKYIDKISSKAEFIYFENKGFVAYYRDKDFGFITMIIVDRKYRGNNIGKKLINLILKDLKNKRIKSCKLEVDIKNINAYKLYSQMGFIFIGTKNSKIEMEYK